MSNTTGKNQDTLWSSAIDFSLDDEDFHSRYDELDILRAPMSNHIVVSSSKIQEVCTTLRLESQHDSNKGCAAPAKQGGEGLLQLISTTEPKDRLVTLSSSPQKSPTSLFSLLMYNTTGAHEDDEEETDESSWNSFPSLDDHEAGAVVGGLWTPAATSVTTSSSSSSDSLLDIQRGNTPHPSPPLPPTLRGNEIINGQTLRDFVVSLSTEEDERLFAEGKFRQRSIRRNAYRTREDGGYVLKSNVHGTRFSFEVFPRISF
eukprot:PhF_6_TR14189/c1_g1_i4/m.22724